MVYFPMIMYKP